MSRRQRKREIREHARVLGVSCGEVRRMIKARDACVERLDPTVRAFTWKSMKLTIGGKDYPLFGVKDVTYGNQKWAELVDPTLPIVLGRLKSSWG